MKLSTIFHHLLNILKGIVKLIVSLVSPNVYSSTYLFQIMRPKGQQSIDTQGKDPAKKPSPVPKKGGEEDKEPLKVSKLCTFLVHTS